MMMNSNTSRKRFTNEEIISAIAFLDEVGKLNDEQLIRRDLKIGEGQKVNHFLSAVVAKESTCLPKQAETLLRLTPLLLKRGSNTVHYVIMTAAPLAIEAYQKTTDLTEKRNLSQAIKTAGMVCMSKRLGATSHEHRTQEFAMFEPFIGETPEYRDAKARFIKRNRPSSTLLEKVGKQAPNAVQMNVYYKYRY